MSSIHKKGNIKVAYIKGAPKKIIRLSSQISVDGEAKTFSDEDKKEIIHVHDELAASGLRILAMAYRELPSEFDDFRPGECGEGYGLCGYDGNAGSSPSRG